MDKVKIGYLYPLIICASYRDKFTHNFAMDKVKTKPCYPRFISALSKITRRFRAYKGWIFCKKGTYISSHYQFDIWAFLHSGHTAVLDCIISAQDLAFLHCLQFIQKLTSVHLDNRYLISELSLATECPTGNGGTKQQLS